MTLKQAAQNVVFTNMLLNRTFLRTRQEQKELRDTVRKSFPSLDGVSSLFLDELMKAATVIHTQSIQLI